MENIDFSRYVCNIDPMIQWWLNQIVKLLIEHGELIESEALHVLLKSSILSDGEDSRWLLRELPFYWAMEIIHAGQGSVPPFWWHDPQLNEKFAEYKKWFNALTDDERLIEF